MSDIFRTLIVTAANVNLARQIAASFGNGGTGMWTTPLSATGETPATHYISTGYVPEQYAYLVPCQVWEWSRDTGQWQFVSSAPGDNVAVYQAAQAAGITCTQQDVDNLIAAADVTEQEPFVAMQRLGLQIVQPAKQELSP